MRGGDPGVASLAILLLLAGITGGLLLLDAGPAPALRHAYLIPTLWAAVRFGRRGGTLVSALGVLFYAPLVLPSFEHGEISRESLEGLLFLGWLAAIGPLAGALVSQARARAERYDTLLAIQHALAREAPFDGLLRDAAAQVRQSLRAHAVTLAVATDPLGPSLVHCQVAGAPHATLVGLREDSAAAWVRRSGQSLFVPDLGSDSRLGGDGLAAGRPRRALVVPLQGQTETIGVMVVERIGEFARGERGAIETVGLQLGLGIENARLAQRQRRFAEELEAKVAAATQRLSELDRAKSDFVSIVSHELRTPLTAIRGFSELVLNRSLPAERRHRCLDYILREAERLGRMVDDLLDLSRIESGKGEPLNRLPLDLRPLLEANAELVGCQSAIHEIRVEVSGELPPVLADRDAVDRILKNLISNAIKYSPQGGPVLIRAARSADDRDRVEVSVEDFGLGIPPEALDRIFEKYYRVAPSDGARTRGLGIGLALVRSLVEAQGGSVTVSSQPGCGSRFRVTLPVVESAGRRAGSDASP